MLRLDNKIGLKIDLYPFFLAKTKCLLIHLESIIMDFITRENHIKMVFFPLYFCFGRRAKFCKNFYIYQVSDAETLQSECTSWPNAFQNLSSNCKKIQLSPPPLQRLPLCSPSTPLTFAPLLPAPHLNNPLHT